MIFCGGIRYFYQDMFDHRNYTHNLSSCEINPDLNSQGDQLPVCLIAQLMEHCIGIAGNMGSNPVQSLFCITCNVQSCLDIFLRSSDI